MAKDDESVDIYTVSVHRNNKTRNITREFWVSQKTGKPSRVGGPSDTTFDPVTGKKLHENYSVNDIMHRPTEEGSAYREWDVETGNLIVEAYAERDAKHRPHDKSAVIFYDRHTGKVTREEYYKDGKRYDPRIKAGNTPPKIT